MIQLNPEKVAKLHDTSALLDRKYGNRGTPTRTAFEEKALAGYYADLLKERRKELRITQSELAKKQEKNAVI
jgi:ribosome-binding protein aMBF1 (putative translation factor)